MRCVFVERSLGSSELEPAGAEEIGRREYRLSCVAARDLRAGQTLAIEDIAFHRPGNGLPPKMVNELVGRVTGKPIKCGSVLASEDLR